MSRGFMVSDCARCFLLSQVISVFVSSPVPIPGKGENSHDQEDSAIHSCTFSIDTHTSHKDAINEFRAGVIKDRERYGGANWTPTKS